MRLPPDGRRAGAFFGPGVELHGTDAAAGCVGDTDELCACACAGCCDGAVGGGVYGD